LGIGDSGIDKEILRRGKKTLIIQIVKSQQTMNQSCSKLSGCFTIQVNNSKEKKRKSSNTEQPLFVWVSSTILESAPMQ